MHLLQFYICWQRIFLIFFLIAIYFKLSYEDVIDNWTRQGTALIEEAKIVGGEIRQCTCAEQRACIVEMQEQALGCIDTCWNMFSKITGHPEKLRKCFTRADAIIERFVTCFENNVDSCLPTYQNKKIPKVNITELFRLGVEKIEKTQAQLTKSLTEGPIRKIINTASEFGVCVKNCFLAKNPNKFCFDKKECQPLLLDTKATKSLRRCVKIINWKEESGQLCECSVKAGISEMHQYCPMLKLMGGGGSQPKGGKKEQAKK